jgi:hypothetical protein
MWEGGPSGVASIKRVVIKNVDEWGTRLSMLQLATRMKFIHPLSIALNLTVRESHLRN